MTAHIQKVLKRELPDVVVDHICYRLEQIGSEQGSAPVNQATPESIRGIEHPFFIEYQNKVWPPAVRP